MTLKGKVRSIYMILEGRSLQFDMIYVYGEKNGRGGNGEIIMKMGVANRIEGSPFHVI